MVIIDHDFLLSDRDVFMCFCYIPPSSSKYYDMYDIDVFDEIESDIAMYASNGSICLLVDLNSRTSSDIELIENDKLS